MSPAKGSASLMLKRALCSCPAPNTSLMSSVRTVRYDQNVKIYGNAFISFNFNYCFIRLSLYWSFDEKLILYVNNK